MDNPDKAIALEPLAEFFEERILSASDTINKICKNRNPLTVSQHPLSEKKALFILESINTLHETAIDQLFIEELMSKNLFFKLAIDYYYERAIKNLNNVTCNTLEAVSHYHYSQPTNKLNKIPFLFKKYVMKKAYAQVECLYNVIFKGHTGTIEGVDANIPSDLAASASKDGTFRLWRLSNGEHLHTFSETSYCGYVKFNRNGSQLATASVYQRPNKVNICIWDTQSRKLLYKMQQDGPMTHLNFFSNKIGIVVLVSKKNVQSIYQLENKQPNTDDSSKENTLCSHLGDIAKGIQTKKEQTPYAREVNNHDWIITNNSHRLWLCQRAVYNTKNKKLHSNVIHASKYAKMTEYEKDLFNTILDQKNNTPEQKKPLLMLHTILG
jgi:WD40 repeat protein